MSGPQIRVRTRKDLARQRRFRGHQCWDHLIAAPLWPMHGANLGTLLRTCDAVGACLAVPRLPWVPEALARGNTLRRPACVHWAGQDAARWLDAQRAAGTRIVGIELADEAVRPARWCSTVWPALSEADQSVAAAASAWALARAASSSAAAAARAAAKAAGSWSIRDDTAIPS